MSVPKVRLDQALVARGLVTSRSQAESYIKLGTVTVNRQAVTKPGFVVSGADDIELNTREQFVSRAGLKLASVAEALRLDFKNKVVLDVGSSTGGFTDFALRRSAAKVIAVDVGTDQLHPRLRKDERIELHEKTDIRDFETEDQVDIVLADVSFISLRAILPHISRLMSQDSLLVAMVKPQFEAGKEQINKGVVKNDSIRRTILKEFESWVQKLFKIVDKADSGIAGSKGNLERFYLLKKLNG